jgi:ATP-binding cassette subfamily B multidrug efflux pump
MSTQGPSAIQSPGAIPETAHALNEDIDEKIFGKAFDRGIVRRFLGYMVPYRRQLWLAIGCVVLFTASQLTIPLVIGTAIFY